MSLTKKINIIGAGNVASFFANRLKDSSIVEYVYARDLAKGQAIADECGGVLTKEMEDINSSSSINLICVSDDAIQSIASQMHPSKSVVHSSGSTDISVLSQFAEAGVLYPLQSISKEYLPVDLNVPICIEASSEKFENELMEIAELVGSKVEKVNSEDRLRLHLAAVMVNNFTNHLIDLAIEEIGEENKNLKLLEPLMFETIRKAIHLGTKNAQTGPARRGDQELIEKHLSIIMNPKTKDLYRTLSDWIKDKY